MNAPTATSWAELQREWQNDLARHECPHDIALGQHDDDDRQADRRHDHSPNPIRSAA